MKYVCNFRHPRTLSEMRQYFKTTCNEIDVVIKVRGRRKPKRLPTAWDDIFRSDQGRSWKHYRKYQWKENNRCKSSRGGRVRNAPGCNPGPCRCGTDPRVQIIIT